MNVSSEDGGKVSGKLGELQWEIAQLEREIRSTFGVAPTTLGSATPTARRWQTREEWAEKIVTRLEASFPGAIQLQRGEIKTDLITWLAGGFVVERKLSRLTEMLKDSIQAGRFGPIVPGSQADDILQTFKQIYTREFLDTIDEEGNLK